MRRTCFASLAGILAFGVIAAGRQPAPRRTFDTDKPGVAPPGFTLSAMRQPTPGAWAVRRVGANGVVAHEADPQQAAGFAMAVSDVDAPRDVVVSARLRLAGGERAGGLVWRFRDALNFHAVILDLSRGEISLYRVADGNRVRLESEDDLELDPEAWHALRVVNDEDEIAVYLGGIRVFDERSRPAPAGQNGRAGLVATGASDVWFDDLGVEPYRKRR